MLYDYYAPLIKCGILVAGLYTGLAAFYALYKSLSKVVVSEEQQGADMASNPSKAPPGGKFKKQRFQQKFKRMEFRQVFYAGPESEWKAQNGDFVEKAVRMNMCVVLNSQNQRMNGLFVFERVLMIPYHFFIDVETEAVRVLFQNGLQLDFSMEECDDDDVIVAEMNHLVFINLDKQLKRYPQFADLRRYTVNKEHDPDAFNCESGQLLTIRPALMAGIGILNKKQLWDISPEPTPVWLVDPDNQDDQCPLLRSLRARARTKAGDCGGPWILDHPSNFGARLAGVHVSSNKEMSTGRCITVTRVMLDQVATTFKLGMPKEIEEAEVVDFEAPEVWHDCRETLENLDLVGALPLAIHTPSKTDLRSSLWKGIEPLTKKPARLRKFELNGEWKDPNWVSFNKWSAKVVRIPLDDIDAALEHVARWYPRPASSKRRVLSLEEAVFGEADGVNESIEANSSVGYPWKLQGKSRRDLFDLEKKWISDEFRESVAKWMSGERGHVVVLDNLKDERLSLEKSEKGVTRIFNIFPFDFNVVLKMLFGDFVFYVISRHRDCPVKLGISPLPDEWGSLYDYLKDNNGGLIAGDMSSWDRVCHFEVMMSVVKWINEWYDDDYSAIRFKLARMSFEPLHYLDGKIFRARAGMPSGSYLTTVVNSLGVLTYIYMFAQECGAVVDDGFSIRPAVYGDDHVVSVAGCERMNQQNLCDWFALREIGYTDESKARPQRPYTTWQDVTFLKRKFSRHTGKIWGTRELSDIYQQIQWYHNSATMRKMNPEQRAAQVLAPVLDELFLHGRQVYDAEKKKILQYAKDKACLDLSFAADPYSKKWDHYMGGAKLSCWDADL
nr:MAG: RNA-dependent RNA polymerase [Riboviria sp.]